MARLPTRDDLGPLPVARSGGIARVNPTIPNIRAPQQTAPRVQLPSNAAIPRTEIPDVAGASADIANINKQGWDSLAKGFTEIEATIDDEIRKRDDLDVMKAKAYRDISMLKFQQELDADPSGYRTYGDRYNEYAAKTNEEALALVSSDRARERLGVEFSVKDEVGRTQVLKTAADRERESQRLDVESALEVHREVFLTSQDPAQKQEAVENMQLAILSAQENGLISGAQAASLQRTYLKGAAQDAANILLEKDPAALDAALSGKAGAKEFLTDAESSGDPTKVNTLGYAGRYQFGAERLSDLGFYTKGEKEKFGKWGGQKWSGTFNIPGFENVKTLEDFLANPDAQEAAWDAHTAKMDEEIAANGFDAYLGRSVDGVRITRSGLYAMLHLGGVGSTKRALEGTDNASDAYGTSVLNYASRAGRYDFFDTLDPLVRADFEIKSAKEGKFNDLMLAINDGQAGIAEIEKARSEGWLTDYAKVSAAESAVGSYQKRDLVGRATVALQDDTKVWDPLDTDNKKMLNAIAPVDALGQKNDNAVEWVHETLGKTGIIPSSVKGTFEGMLRSSDPKQVTWALDTMSGLEQQNPVAFARDMGEAAVKKVVRFREQTGYRTEEEIVAELRRSEDPAQAEARARMRTEGRKIAQDLPDGTITNEFDPSWFYSEPSMPEVPIVSAELRVDFERLYAESYEGDEDVALKTASALLSTKWGTTDATGERQLMKYPPENYYRVQGLEDDWMSKQASEELSPYLKDGERFVLRYDDQTESEISRGEPPAYTVLVEKESGEWVPLVNEQTGKPRRYGFNPQRYIEAKQKEMQKRREKFAKDNIKAQEVRAIEMTPQEIIGQINPIMGP